MTSYNFSELGEKIQQTRVTKAVKKSNPAIEVINEDSEDDLSVDLDTVEN